MLTHTVYLSRSKPWNLKSFIYQELYFISVLENIKIYIKSYIKIAATQPHSP
jgi:hypothetical protein